MCENASPRTIGPNVLFVITDDQGYGDLSCHGNDIISTPNLDALHAESLRRTNFHVGPTCAPTRAGLMTGHYRDRVPDRRARFYGMINCIDDNLGRLREKLNELGIADNTILIFMTDNGTSAGRRLDENQFVIDGYNAGMRGMKGSEYDGGHRTPLFLHWPDGGSTEGRDVDELTANIDVLPTLIDLCGIHAPEGLAFDGISLAPMIRDGAELNG